MDSMEIRQFITFSTKYVVQILLWKTYEEEVILLKTSTGTFHNTTWCKQWEAAI